MAYQLTPEQMYYMQQQQMYYLQQQEMYYLPYYAPPEPVCYTPPQPMPADKKVFKMSTSAPPFTPSKADHPVTQPILGTHVVKHIPTVSPLLTCKDTPVLVEPQTRVLSASNPGLKAQLFLESMKEGINPKFNLSVVKTAQKVSDVAFRHLSDPRDRRPLTIAAHRGTFFLHARETIESRNQIHHVQRWINAIEDSFAPDAVSMRSLCTGLHTHSTLASTQDRARSHREIGMMLFYLNTVAYTGTHTSRIESIRAGSQFYYYNTGAQGARTLAHHSVLAELSDDYPKQLEGRLLSFFNTYLSSSEEPTEELIIEGKKLFMELIAHGMSYRDVESLFYAILSKDIPPEEALSKLKQTDLAQLFRSPLRMTGPNPSTGLGYTSPMYLLSQLGELEAAAVNYVDSLLETHRVTTTAAARPVNARELARELLQSVAQGKLTPFDAQTIFTSFTKEAFRYQESKIQQLIELERNLDAAYDDLRAYLAKDEEKRPSQEQKETYFNTLLEKLNQCGTALNTFEAAYTNIYTTSQREIQNLPEYLNIQEEKAALSEKIRAFKDKVSNYKSLTGISRFAASQKVFAKWQEKDKTALSAVLVNVRTGRIPQPLLELQPIIQAELEGIEVYEAKIASKQFAAEDPETTHALGLALRARSASTAGLRISDTRPV